MCLKATCKIILLLLLPVQLWCANAFNADDAQEYFNRGEYEQALDIWYALTDEGKAGAGVYYNIGLAETHLDRTAHAIYAFEQAARLKPANGAIRDALADAKKRMTNGAIPVNPFFLTTWAQYVLALCRPGVWALLSLLAGIGLIYSLLQSGDSSKSGFLFSGKGRIGLACLGVILLITALLSYRQLYRQDEAIIFGEIEFHKAPADESPLIRTLHPGEKVIIRDNLDGWCQIHLMNYEVGWVKHEALLPISLGKSARSR